VKVRGLRLHFSEKLAGFFGKPELELLMAMNRRSSGWLGCPDV
jgi:hypothetical protein